MANNSNAIIGIVAAIAIVAAAYMYMNKPDDRNGIQKVGDAVAELPNGADKAARELKDRTPAEKLKDDVKDATH